MWRRLFLAALQFVCVATLFDGCDQVINLNETHPTHIFQSSNFVPYNINIKYAPGSSCRVHYIAPLGYIIRIDGRISLDRKIRIFSCAGQSQKFFVSRDGNKEFKNPDLFCSVDTLALDSVSNEMTLGYISGIDGSGRFQVSTKIVKNSPSTCECGWGVYSFQRLNTYRTFKGFVSTVGVYHIGKDEIVCTGVISECYFVHYFNIL